MAERTSQSSQGPGARLTIDAVTRHCGELKYMSHAQAEFLREFVLSNGLRDLLELGTYHGKSAAYLAAILEEEDSGRLTTLDTRSCLDLAPNVHDLLATLGLAHRVEVRLHERSFTMTLLAMMEEAPRRQFDFCYFDGGHTWDATGYAFLLVDRMLRPGAWVLFDDLDWTMDNQIQRDPEQAARYARYPPEELVMPQIRKVFEILVPELGYRNRSEPRPGWGLAQKPA